MGGGISRFGRRDNPNSQMGIWIRGDKKASCMPIWGVFGHFIVIQETKNWVKKIISVPIIY